ncbi:hypothetical protein M5E86_14195 [Blautia wexlerae]|nr:hypothetical protein M5E86_14195 [Blautia wexlerae]
MGEERIQAMIALQMLVGLVFIFMGVTRLADKFVHAVPNSVKGGILLASTCYSYGRTAGRERKYAQISSGYCCRCRSPDPDQLL